MAGKGFFIDTSKCTACRGCQVACKNWNQPFGTKGTKTVQRGNHQNPEDLSFFTYKLVRFSEVAVGGKPRWYFFADQCRHCLEPPCMYTAQSLGYKNITRDEKTGAVLYNPNIKVKLADGKAIRESCPWDIPRVNEKTGIMAKCTMCFNRITNGMLPACVKVCPTGTMNFGDLDKMTEMAQKRLKQVKSMYPNAQLTGPEIHRAIILFVDDPKKYHKFASSDVEPTIGASVRNIVQSVTSLAG
ncbi:MAG: 4Fe-4S dicluster domain-containing protein [Nitrospirota bacterium]